MYMDDLAGLLHHHHTPLTALALHDSHLTTQLATPVHVVYGVMSSFHDGFFFCFLACFLGHGRLISPHSQIDKKIPQNDTRALFSITDLGDGKGLREVYGQWFFFHGNDNYDFFPIGAILSFFPRIITRCAFLARGSRGGRN